MTSYNTMFFNRQRDLLQRRQNKAEYANEKDNYFSGKRKENDWSAVR